MPSECDMSDSCQGDPACPGYVWSSACQDQVGTAKLVRELDAMTGEDPEAEHGRADEILLAAAPADVAGAYRRAAERSPWWATS